MLWLFISTCNNLIYFQKGVNGFALDWWDCFLPKSLIWVFVLWLKLVMGRREMGSSRRVASHDYVEGSLLLVAPAQVGGGWEGWWSGGGGVWDEWSGREKDSLEAAVGHEWKCWWCRPPLASGVNKGRS